MKTVTLTHYIIRAIRDEGASHVFLVPGGYVDNFSQALVDVDGMTPIVCASEAGAAYMADGFARSAGRFGVCMGISGPGASNMITGLSASQVDKVPVLAITGDSPLAWRNRLSIQDPGEQGLKTTQLLGVVSDAQAQVLDDRLIEDHLHSLMPVLNGTKKGVAHLAIPLDIQLNRQVYQYVNAYVEAEAKATLPDTAALDSAFQTMSECKNIVVLVGSGVRKAGACDALMAFAERYSLPVATTMSAKGDFPENHALSLGGFGWAGSPLANETMLTDEIDCLLVIGSRLGQINTMCWSEELAQGRKLIQIDLDESSLNRSYIADHAIVSDANAALRYLLNPSEHPAAQDRLLASQKARLDWLAKSRQARARFYDSHNCSSDSMPLHPARAITELSQCMPEDTQLFVDNGAHTFFATHYWPVKHPNQYFNIIKYSGAMGWAIAASIGAKLARPTQPCVAVVGDGCMLMQGLEIQTAARYQLKGMIFLVLNNKAHGNPKLRTEGFSEKASQLTDIVDHDWAGFAHSLGVRGFTVSTPENLMPVYRQALEEDGPVLIDVKCGLYPTPTKVFDETFMKEFNRYVGRTGTHASRAENHEQKNEPELTLN